MLDALLHLKNIHIKTKDGMLRAYQPSAPLRGRELCQYNKMIPARGPQTKVILTIFVCSFAFAIAVASAIVIATAVVFLLLFLLLSRLINLSLLLLMGLLLSSRQLCNKLLRDTGNHFRVSILLCKAFNTPSSSFAA